MLTIIWKELRENSKWAVLAFVGLVIAEFYTLSLGRNDRSNPYNELTLCSSAFLMVTSFGCSAVAAALGVVQILPELNRDRWAALLHRPVSRRAIFFGKVVAGLLLYFAATLLSFLLSAIYVAIPGQFASPLVPGMLFPGLSDISFGPAVYFAALLVCLHRGRWFGSRGLAGLAIIPLFLMDLSFGWSFLVTLLGSVLFMLAAWQAIESNGGTQRSRGSTRIPLVILVLAGAGTALIILLAALHFLPLTKTVSSGSYTQFEITQDDDVFIASQRGDGSAPVVRDMNGHAVTDERYVGNHAGRNVIQLLPFATVGAAALQGDYLRSHPRNLRNYVDAANTQSSESENWYLLVREKYFVGYDKLSRRRVGTAGIDGFKLPGVSPHPFPERLQNYDFWSARPFYYWSGPQLYSVDFSERALKPFFNAGHDTIFGAVGLFGTLSRDKSIGVAVALSAGVRVFDPQGQPIFTTPYQRDPAVWPDIWIGTNERSKTMYLQYSPYYLLPDGRTHPQPPVFLDQVDWQGHLLHTYSYPSEQTQDVPRGVVGYLSAYSAPFLAIAAELGKMYFSPAPIDLDAYDGMPTTPWSIDGPYMDALMIAIIGLVLAGLTWTWSARAGFSRKRSAWWSVFVFFFGLPGFLTFRLTSKWPTNVDCPSCGRRRPVGVEECPHSHQRWPLTPLNGFEIFDHSLSGESHV